MRLALWCVLVAGLLPFVGTVLAKSGGGRPYNNRDPRAWLEGQSGWRRRANNFQVNSFEAFPFFAAAVIVATLQQVPAARLDALAAAFIALRLAYLVCYLADWHWARSVAWLGGLGVTVAIFVAAA